MKVLKLQTKLVTTGGWKGNGLYTNVLLAKAIIMHYLLCIAIKLEDIFFTLFLT